MAEIARLHPDEQLQHHLSDSAVMLIGTINTCSIGLPTCSVQVRGGSGLAAVVQVLSEPRSPRPWHLVAPIGKEVRWNWGGINIIVSRLAKAFPSRSLESVDSCSYRLWDSSVATDAPLPDRIREVVVSPKRNPRQSPNQSLEVVVRKSEYLSNGHIAIEWI